jgi:hypothetical protein
MIAIKRLQNILWILIVAFGALSAYLISLRVATERNAVQALDRRIHHARADIRYLETEFEARSNMRQLEQWNNRDYRYVAPNAGQYLPDERSLASLDGVETNGDTYVAPPVMMAMADTNVQSPAAAAADTASPAPAQIRDDETIIRAASAPRPAPRAAPVSTRSAEAQDEAPQSFASARLAKADAPAKPNPVARKAARMALLDEKLLDDRTLRDLGAKAAAEGSVRSNR